MIDKDIERNRYNRRAERVLHLNDYTKYRNPRYLQPAYDAYQKLFEGKQRGSKVLEIGAGMGENTEFLLERGFAVYAVDISSKSVDVMNWRFAKYDNFYGQVADMEKLPFDGDTFDMVCSAGSLSYGDQVIVRNEIYRVLKRGGAFISLDSLNNNPIYRINRYVHYLRGNRSRGTLQRMPTLSLIEAYASNFSSVETQYFGSITWLFPVLNRFLNEDIVMRI